MIKNTVLKTSSDLGYSLLTDIKRTRNLKHFIVDFDFSHLPETVEFDQTSEVQSGLNEFNYQMFD